MASFSCSRYFLAFFSLNLCLGVIDADFSFKNFGKDSNFESQLALFGDAKVDIDSLSVQIAGSRDFSSGRVICKKPINLVDGRSRNMVSFSSYFVFSISREENGDGLAFVLLPSGFNLSGFGTGSMGMLSERRSKFVAVEFDTYRDEKYGDVNGNHIGIDIESLVSVKVSNVSSIGLVLNSGEKLQSWIDYEASGKRFEVRLSKFGDSRPVDPLLSYPIDLSKMWESENVTVGLSSSSGHSTQKSIVYSWSFNSRTMPHWMHSEPMNPETSVEKGQELKVPKKNDCALRIIAALIFGTGCGALGAFFVLFLWTVFGNRRPVVPEDFEFKKLEVSIDKSTEDGKKVVDA